MTRRIGWVLPGLAVLVLAALAPPRAGAASNWVAGLTALSTTQSRGGTLGVTTSVTASCVSALSSLIKVDWPAVASATKYVVFQSFAGGAYTQAATVATTTWTSGPNNSLGSYTYKVQAGRGASWLGPQSAASGARLIVVGLLCT